MSSHRSLISFVLVLALLAGQALVAAHDTDHGLAPGAAHACAVCAYAHGAGAGAVPSLPVLALAPCSEAPELPQVENPLAATLRHHPIRGPPALLA